MTLSQLEDDVLYDVINPLLNEMSKEAQDAINEMIETEIERQTIALDHADSILDLKESIGSFSSYRESEAEKVSQFISEDKSQFFQSLVPQDKSLSLFAKQKLQEQISEHVTLDETDWLFEKTQDNNYEIVEDQDSQDLIKEALKSFGISIPLDEDFDKFYESQKNSDFLLESKVDIFTRATQNSKQAQALLSDYVTSAEEYRSEVIVETETETETEDGLTELSELAVYRKLIKKIDETVKEQKLKEQDFDEMDKSIEEYNNLKESGFEIPEISDKTLLGMYILAEQLRELITPIEEALKAELGSDDIHYNPFLTEYHEKRDTSPQSPMSIIIKKSEKSDAESGFEFNVVTLQEGTEASDISQVSKLIASEDEIKDEDVLKAKLTLNQRVKPKKEWVYSKEINPELCTIISTRKFDIAYIRDEYRVLPKGAIEKEEKAREAREKIAKVDAIKRAHADSIDTQSVEKDAKKK